MQEELDRIAAALAEAGEVVARVRRGAVTVTLKTGGDPVTEVDTAVDAVLRKRLPRPGEGWLSEETADDGSRLRMTRVWVVDPLDGTREFVAGIPEWAISVALVEEGSAVAGGVFNPASG
ncbi:MAG TPA: inositol monophosphatase family protein, partial [Candidatus Polarisedimenticolaceae bacterium]|nr:inositol monophosphatase family protein [Candidatus Polarisedimenticolaceae bacterium]